MELSVREGSVWQEFLKQQHAEIQMRLERYNNPQTAQEQLIELGGLTPYQSYKIDTVSPFLREALDRIMAGTYGICNVCEKQIPVARLRLVPAALACVECDAKKGGQS